MQSTIKSLVGPEESGPGIFTVAEAEHICLYAAMDDQAGRALAAQGVKVRRPKINA